MDEVGDGRLLHVTPIDGSYRFVHELARRTVVAQIPPGRAMRMHLSIADGLERERQTDVFAIAHHLRLAMPAAAPRRAASALLAASRRARDVGDFETSRNLAEQALRIADQTAMQADALVLMASGAQSLGDREAAAHHICTAVDLALESNASTVLASALFVKSVVMCSWGNDDLVDRIRQSIRVLLTGSQMTRSTTSTMSSGCGRCASISPGHGLVERRCWPSERCTSPRAHGDPLTRCRRCTHSSWRCR